MQSSGAHKMIENKLLLGESVTAIITALITGLATWLLASVKKVSRAEMESRLAERDRLIIQPLKEQLHDLEVAHKEFVTRAEFNGRFDALDRQISSLTDLIRDNLIERPTSTRRR